MKTKILTLILITIFSISISAQAKTDYKPSLDLIFKAFKEKKYDLVKSLFDSNVKIGDLPTGMNDQIIPQIISQLPEATSYSVTKTTAEGGNVRIETIYKTVLIPEMKRNFVFNKAGKIIDFDVLAEVSTETKNKSN